MQNQIIQSIKASAITNKKLKLYKWLVVSKVVLHIWGLIPEYTLCMFLPQVLWFPPQSKNMHCRLMGILYCGGECVQDCDM